MVITNSHLSKEALYLAKLHNVEVWEGYGKDDGIEPPQNNNYVYDNHTKYQNNRKNSFININDMIEMDEMYDDDDEE